MSTIKLRIFLKGGLERELEISNLKPTSYIFDAASKLAGKPIEYLETEDGIPIPPRGKMIKDVPLKNGMTIHEDADEVPQIDPRAHYKDPYLSSQVWIGRVKRDEVFHVKVWFLGHRKYITFMVYKDATVDEFKEILAQLKRANGMRDTVYEYTFDYERETWGSTMTTQEWLGWHGNIERDGRRYVGSETLASRGVKDEQVFMENYLPVTREQEEREYKEATRRRQKNREEQAERAKRGEAETEDWWSKFERENSSSSYSTPPPPQRENKKKSCSDILREEKISSRKDFLKWAIINHPDKFPESTDQEKKSITEKFQIVSACVDSTYSRGGRRVTRKHKRKVRKYSRKHN